MVSFSELQSLQRDRLGGSSVRVQQQETEAELASAKLHAS